MYFGDYIYYRVCKAYSKTKDSSPEGAAVCIISGVQGFNIITCFMLLALIERDKSVLNLFIVIIIIGFFLIFNYIRYIYRGNNNYKLMREKWDMEPNATKKGVVVILYIIISVALFIGLAIYLGSKK